MLSLSLKWVHYIAMQTGCLLLQVVDYQGETSCAYCIDAEEGPCGADHIPCMAHELELLAKEQEQLSSW